LSVKNLRVKYEFRSLRISVCPPRAVIVFLAFERSVSTNWRALNPEKAKHHTAVLALRRMKAEVGEAALAELIQVQPAVGEDPFNVDHMAGQIVWRIKSFGLGTDVTSISALLSIAETPEFQAIEKEVGPMIAEVEAADAKAEAERLAKQRAAADLEIARAAARDRLTAAIEDQPEVAEKKRELAALQDPAGKF
jgi:hypothetical protein